MKNTTMKINCWKLEDGNEVPMLSTATLDGFEWNGKYRITVSDDDGSLGLPFLFATDDTAILTVETTEQEGMGTDDKKIKQVISCVPRSLGNEITCSRTRSYKGKEHVWSAWETISSASGTKVTWDASSCVDTFITAGIYNISGERLNVKDGLPIANSNPGHTIKARLVVLDSSISGTGDTDDKCITQILTLSNRTGGDGDVYIRTGRAHSTNVLAGGSGWEPWGKLQQNIEVGQVTSLNNFIGNGIYSGVYTNGSSFFETFVMVVINNYAVAGATGQVRSISQFKYALNVDCTFSYKTRTGRGNTGIEWGSWVDLGAATTTDIQDGAITAQKLSSDVRKKVENPLRPLYIAAGAAYNAETGLYSLNGVDDLTEEQISLSYAFKDVVYRLNVPRVLQNISIRAIFPHRATTQVSQIFKNTPFNGTGSLGSTKIEIFKTVLGINDINSIVLDRMLPCEQNSIWAATFYNCTKLREIWPINTEVVTRIADDTFLNCSSLAELRLYSLKCNLPIQYSPTLSKDSVLYIIKYATPASAITITLHQDAYARLADDADIVAALEAQPLISLVSA